MKILIVDDNEMNILLLYEILIEKYSNIMTAKNGKEALELIYKQRPDIVLLDILMPDIDGIQVLKEIKKNYIIQNTIVIMVTAKVEKNDVKEALLLGASDYIKKPVDKIELFTKLALHERFIRERKRAEQYQIYANIHDSLEIARLIQQNLLPDKATRHSVFPESFFLYIPKDIIGGDFYFVTKVNDKRFVAMFDCTGHGIPGALLAVIVYMSLHKITVDYQITEPLEIIKELRYELAFHLSRSGDVYTPFNSVEGIFIEVDDTQQNIKAVNLNSHFLILRKGFDSLIINDIAQQKYLDNENFSLYRILPDKNTLGPETDINNIKQLNIRYKNGDIVYMASDGFADQIGGLKNTRYSKKNFFRFIFNSFLKAKKLSTQKAYLYEELREWSNGNEQTDDVTVVAFQL